MEANKRSVSRGREGVRGDADASGLDVPRGREIHPGDKVRAHLSHIILCF
jgi:hypothetical protein